MSTKIICIVVEYLLFIQLHAAIDLSDRYTDLMVTLNSVSTNDTDCNVVSKKLQND